MKNNLLILCSLLTTNLYALPSGFVYLKDVAPNVIQKIKYATPDNFTGKKIKGYDKPACILTKKAATSLKKAADIARKDGYNIIVFDCYRPVKAVQNFINWSEDPNNTSMKQKYYPNIPKAHLFKLGYIAKASGHSRGSTVDLSLVKKQKNGKFVLLDMGTRFDYLDPKANFNNKHISKKNKQEIPPKYNGTKRL